MSTGENEQGLRKIIDMTRIGSVLLLFIHYYFYCYGFFKLHSLNSSITDSLLQNFSKTGIFDHPVYSKLLSFSLLLISFLGSKGRKNENFRLPTLMCWLTLGVILFFSSGIIFHLRLEVQGTASIYLLLLLTGYLVILAQGTRLSRLIRQQLKGDIFNRLNESFPQEERYLFNEYSINLPAQYEYKGRKRKSYINIINPFRGLLVLGSPGSGKSWFVIQHVIRQHIEKGFSMFIYDFKFDDLSRIAYNCLIKNKHRYPVAPQFFVIDFDRLSHSHRCNPLDPTSMHDITDAMESARTILLGLNREWINKQGDFFVESPINFLTAVIWFLRRYEGGKWCTLPHVIEMMKVDYDELFSVLNTEPEIEVLINPFISAYKNDAMEQLEGQVASAKIGMARLASPQLYWILSGNDFTLDINDPANPKIVCMGNNPEKQQIYGAVLSLYISRLIRQVNKKGRLKSSLIFDEFPTIFFNHIDALIATARSNKVATTLGIQDLSQLRKDYGKDQADVIMNITGNIICGQVMGDTAKQLSERFGKIMQDRESLSINRLDTSVSKSKQLDYAIPSSKIAALSSGEFVGMVADDPAEKIALKMFHAQVLHNAEKLEREQRDFMDLPLLSDITPESILDNYYEINMHIKELILKETDKLKQSKGS